MQARIIVGEEEHTVELPAVPHRGDHVRLEKDTLVRITRVTHVLNATTRMQQHVVLHAEPDPDALAKIAAWETPPAPSQN
jgi:hypothetical protein